MIKLMVDDRCHNCEDFDPVAEKLNQCHPFRSDICVTCKKADRCQNLREENLTTPSWIYEEPPAFCDDDVRLLDDIHKAEQVLGFKLFYWQKHFILHGIERHTGRTTADQLRNLLRNKSMPIKIPNNGSPLSRRIYKEDLARMRDKLITYGIETAEIKI